jgi:FkbM family methyltransferase
MKVNVFGREIKLANPSWETEARWNGRLSPEPETVDWIESMQPGEVFFDIGANVGRFSIMAACRGLKVFSFEPQLQQCAELWRAAHDNKLDITPYCVALTNKLSAGKLPPGRSAVTFSQAADGHYQGSVGVDLDSIAQGIGATPDHIKIDVDGNEPEILTGGLHTIRSAKSVLIEIDPGASGHSTIAVRMKNLGFTFDPKQVQACEVTDVKFKGMANHIFTKCS